MKKQLNVAVIGTKFMGKAHCNAWGNAPKFFDTPYTTAVKVVSGRDKEATSAFAENWGIPETTDDWRKAVERDDIDIVDVCVPTNMHHEVVIAAAAAGKHVFCEKPCAMSYKEAKEMAEAMQKSGKVHYLNHNYRRVPAVAFAKKLIEDGKIGQIYHWRGAYLQDWIMDPDFPLTWHLQKEYAGAGPHFDLNSHSVDLARYLVGEIDSVSAVLKTFIEERPLPTRDSGVFKAGTVSSEKGKVTVDDASFMVTEFKNGALGSFSSSRFAGGRKNFNTFEIYGSKGSLTFNMEQMNELQFYDATEGPNDQGFKTIMVTNATHPYMAAWWAPGHIIGYEHAFSHAVSDFLSAIAEGGSLTPNLFDGAEITRVLEAAILSSNEGRRVNVSEIV